MRATPKLKRRMTAMIAASDGHCAWCIMRQGSICRRQAVCVEMCAKSVGGGGISVTPARHCPTRNLRAPHCLQPRLETHATQH
jgi:hypothetical protein